MRNRTTEYSVVQQRTDERAGVRRRLLKKTVRTTEKPCDVKLHLRKKVWFELKAIRNAPAKQKSSDMVRIFVVMKMQ